MSEEERFDAIVIGAGLSGATCAYTLAKAGKSVLLIERGTSAGSKNVTGGRMYTYSLDLVEPGLMEEAVSRGVLERKVVREQIVLLDEQSAMTCDYYDQEFVDPVAQSYTVLRARFDEWLAGKAEEEGVMTACGILVENVIEKDGRIVGVVSGEDEIYGDVVVAADGVNSFIGQKAGLSEDITAHSVGVGVKEVIKIPKDLLENRFHVGPDEGVAQVILGATKGISGGGFLYTNQDSISLGLVLNPEFLGKQQHRIHDIFQDMKMHPAIYPLIAEGITAEYGAHLVPEAGWRAVPRRLYRDGLLLVGDAAGFVINAGIILRGMDLAITSGLAAARAILEAENAGKVGPAYLKHLNKLNLIAGMKHFAGWPDILAISRMFTVYPKMANEVMRFLFTVKQDVPKKIPKAIWEIAKRHVSLGDLLSDGWKGFRSI